MCDVRACEKSQMRRATVSVSVDRFGMQTMSQEQDHKKMFHYFSYGLVP